MENAYGIGVKNRYELFYDEDVDPLEIIRRQEEEKEKRKTDKACKDKTKTSRSGKSSSMGISKKSKENAPINSTKPSESTELPSKPRTKPFADRIPKNIGSFEEPKELEERKNFRNREDPQTSNLDNRERDGEFRRGRGTFCGRGGRGRGRGGFSNNFENRPRREFDKHSGIDKTRHVDKRESFGGSSNWGDIKTEPNTRKKESESNWIDEEFETPVEKQNESSNWDDPVPENDMPTSHQEEVTEKVVDETIVENESKENEPIPEERQESTREMTLDEWKREQEAKRVVPKYNLRKPGEGEDGNQWKKLYMLKKKIKEDDDDEEEEEDDDVDDEEFARRGRQRQLVDIQINFNDSRRGRGRGRGGRASGPRGGGQVSNRDTLREERTREIRGGSNVAGRGLGRGNPKIKSGQQSAPRVDDWNDFPSLVAV